MNGIVAALDRRFYPGVEKNWDDRLFRERILTSLRPEFHVLDLGAGAGIVEQMNFRGKVARVCGVDLDPRVVENPMLDEGRIADGKSIPYGDAEFDLVFSDNVMEHLDDPVAVLKEVRRVFKPGGRLLFKTPNRTHYMPLIARLTPHWFHQSVNRWRGRAEVDIFPTLYRVNTSRHVHTTAAKAGLNVLSVLHVESRPEYLRMAWPAYLCGIIYERIVNGGKWLEPFRILLIAELKKPGF